MKPHPCRSCREDTCPEGGCDKVHAHDWTGLDESEDEDTE